MLANNSVENPWMFAVRTSDDCGSLHLSFGGQANVDGIRNRR